MTTADEILNRLQAQARPDQVAGMGRYGMSTVGRLGVSMPALRALARQVGRDHDLALGLWQTGVPEARIVAALTADPQALTAEQMEDWVQDFDSWDVCDQVCMNLFDKTPLAWTKVREWAEREPEFVRRAAFSLLASLAWHDKTADDEAFLALLPVIRRAATDERNYVKKAVSWALRHIGKRNLNLNRAAIAAAREMRELPSRSAHWIASQAMGELESEAVRDRLRAKNAS